MTTGGPCAAIPGTGMVGVTPDGSPDSAGGLAGTATAAGPTDARGDVLMGRAASVISGPEPSRGRPHAELTTGHPALYCAA